MSAPGAGGRGPAAGDRGPGARRQGLGATGRRPDWKGGPINSFRDLRVWQAGMDLVQATYGFTKSFPGTEAFGLTGQMRRAAVSIPSNVAEGHTRDHTREFLQHLSVAQASLAELETQVEIAIRLEYGSSAEASRLLALIGALGKQLYALRNAVLQRSDLVPGPRSLAPSGHPIPDPWSPAPGEPPC
ncbi:MAG: four helix bundle protein [Chloroflexota bacterium]|nr:four helix bundle protein [Chloroflexota bacterium]